MKNKAKIIIGILSISSLLLAFGMHVTAQSKEGSIMSAWGKILKVYSENEEVEKPEIYMLGNSAQITEADIKQGTELFVLSGMDREQAREEAIKYAMKREALYEEAINNGYTVTDEEVRAYLEELKEAINSADNKEDALQVIKAFDSEKKYWDFEFEVYKKDLPIQKYVESLETMYKAKDTKLSKQTVQADYEEDFNSFFEKYKEKLAEEQNYKLVK
jgi:hypothetical protein